MLVIGETGCGVDEHCHYYLLNFSVNLKQFEEMKVYSFKKDTTGSEWIDSSESQTGNSPCIQP